MVLSKGSKVTADDIKMTVKKNLSTIKMPKYVTFLDAIPKNAVGKYDLVTIKERFGNIPDAD